MPARQGWGSGRHFLPVPCSGPSSVPGTPPAPQCPVLSLHGCGLMGPSVWGKGSLVSLLLPALRQRVHDLGRENQVRSPAGSWLPGLQQPGSPWCSAGQGYKACTSSLHPSAHPPAPKRTSPVHPNAHLSAARCTSHFIPMRVLPASRCAPPPHAHAQPHAAPRTGSPVACWRAEAACQHSTAPGPMCCTLYCGTSKNYFGMCLCGLQQCPSLR